MSRSCREPKCIIEMAFGLRTKRLFDAIEFDYEFDIQCDLIGHFLKVLADKISETKNSMTFWAILRKHHFKVKTTVATFRETYGNIWASFNSCFWSHC